MLHDLEQTVALLARTPAALDAFLRDLPDAWTHRNEGENTWSAFQIVDHLVDGERNVWLPRTRHLLQFGDSRPFESFDRLSNATARDKPSLPELLDEFARLRSENLSELRAMHLQPHDLERRGLHPALGAVTLSELLATWPAHDLSHLHQLSRVMAHQYREAIGPWTALLGVMKCAGHSE